jgi:purine nucleosidase/pyrimidine-specific ribonucleoside hydrolase
MKNVLIDCDPGIDDSVALLYALHHDGLEVRAITTVSGNLPSDRCSLNARRILHLFNSSTGEVARPDIPVARGPPKPLVRPYPRDPFSHGSDGLGDVGLTDVGGREEDGRFAPDLIVETVHRYEGVLSEGERPTKGLTILCLGPLTNLALAIMKDPNLPAKVAEVVWIGGSFGFHNTGALRATGDNPVSEWNAYVDPEAASLVFNAGFDGNLTALGLDVVTLPSMELSPSHRQRLLEAVNPPKIPSAKFLLDLLRFAEKRGFDSWCCLIDSLAVAVAIDPSIVEIEQVKVAVETQSSLSLGQTIVDRRERVDFQWTHLPTIKAAKAVDADRFLESLVRTLSS